MENNKNSKMEIDQNLYSRQIGTFGMEAMGKLVQMNVLICGLRGLGVEIAKNIILAGPKSVSLYDPELVSLRDLGSNFYLHETHIGKTRRDQASSTQLKELNPYVAVDCLENLPNEKLKEAAQRYSDEVREKHTPIDDFDVNEEDLKKKS